MTKPLPKLKGYANGLYKSLKPEDISSLVAYSLSINPAQQPLQTNLGKMNLNAIPCWEDKILKSLNRLSNCIIKLHLEISSLGRLHYHGTIVIKNISNFYYHDIPLLKVLGSFEIDTINDMITWNAYCTKQNKIMTSFAKEHGISIYIQNKSK